MTIDNYSIKDITLWPAMRQGTGDVVILKETHEGKFEKIGYGRAVSCYNYESSVIPDSNVINFLSKEETLFKNKSELMNTIGFLKFHQITGNRIPKFTDENDNNENYYKIHCIGRTEYQFNFSYFSKNIIKND